MSDVVLYDYWRSSASYRVRIALNLAKIPYRAVSVDLVAQDQKSTLHLERNPQGLVPVLDIDGDRFTQSLAILDYLDETRTLGLLPQDPVQLRNSTREVTASLIASGISPERSILFNQSRVPQHAQLAWIFNCVARLGWLNRMTQFKEKAGKHRENASVGLYAYPNLMAADIMAYKATHVPVGEDQKQHLELTRDIAQKFNSDFGVEFFPLVEPLIFGEATRVMSLRDGSKKMSKSDPSDQSRITFTDTADEISKKLEAAGAKAEIK